MDEIDPARLNTRLAVLDMLLRTYGERSEASELAEKAVVIADTLWTYSRGTELKALLKRA